MKHESSRWCQGWEINTLRNIIQSSCSSGNDLPSKKQEKTKQGKKRERESDLDVHAANPGLWEPATRVGGSLL